MNAVEMLIQRTNEEVERCAKLAETYPLIIPPKAIAEFLHTTQATVNKAIDCGAFGMVWQGEGKPNKRRLIHTMPFIWWYLHINPLELAVLEGSEMNEKT